MGQLYRRMPYKSVLKHYVKKEEIEVEYKLVDLFTENQEQLYTVLKKNNSLKNLVKNVITLPFSKQLKVKHQKFNDFIKRIFKLRKDIKRLKN